MNDQTKPQQQSQEAIDRNDPAIDPQTPGNGAPSGNGQAQSADPAVDQKQQNSDNSNEFSPGFKPEPDRPKSGDATDADIDTDGG
ncbi:hypothetical protein GIW70_23650 [Pseudomonas syringae]|nr:hypothetical protein [Pseudomonas syringae]MCF5071176.1 hypothetical protein [Pseudomonas syringae]